MNPRFIYVGHATAVARIPHHNGDLHASGPTEIIVPDIPGFAQLAGGGHWTQDVTFTKDGKHLLVSIGSGWNVDDPDTHSGEFHRANMLEYTPDGKFEKVLLMAFGTALVKQRTRLPRTLMLYQ